MPSNLRCLPSKIDAFGIIPGDNGLSKGTEGDFSERRSVGDAIIPEVVWNVGFISLCFGKQKLAFSVRGFSAAGLRPW